MTVDEYVETRVLPQFQDVVARLRQLMRETAPDAEEAIGYGMPVYRKNRIFAWFTASQREITFAFARGTQFEDSYGLLKGSGRTSRHVKIKSLDGVNQEALVSYIRQALDLDTQ